MVYTGKLMYCMWGHSTSLGGGNTATQKHIGFNPLKVVPTPADDLQEKTSPEYMANSCTSSSYGVRCLCSWG